jgi:hypothetical protein
MSNISPTRRFSILARDGFRCVYCGSSPDVAELRVDHVTPVIGGGGDDDGNLATACHPCNAGKSDKSLPDGVILGPAGLTPAPRQATQEPDPVFDAMQVLLRVARSWIEDAVSSALESSRGTATTTVLLSPEDYAESRGISTTTVRRLCRNGLLAHTRIGRLIRIAPDAEIDESQESEETPEDIAERALGRPLRAVP